MASRFITNHDFHDISWRHVLDRMRQQLDRTLYSCRSANLYRSVRLSQKLGQETRPRSRTMTNHDILSSAAGENFLPPQQRGKCRSAAQAMGVQFRFGRSCLTAMRGVCRATPTPTNTGPPPLKRGRYRGRTAVLTPQPDRRRWISASPAVGRGGNSGCGDDSLQIMTFPDTPLSGTEARP